MALLFDPSDMPPTGRLVSLGTEGLDACPGVHTVLSLQAAARLNRQLKPNKSGEDLFWTTDVTKELPIRVAESGPASLPPLTVVDFFADTVRRYPDSPALAFQPHSAPRVLSRDAPLGGREKLGNERAESRGGGHPGRPGKATGEKEKGGSAKGATPQGSENPRSVKTSAETELTVSRATAEDPAREKDDGGSMLTSLSPRKSLDAAAPPSYIEGPLPGWCMYTWQGYWNDICMFAKALLYLGCDRRSRIALMGCNSPAWAIGYFGAIFIDGIAVGIYTTNSVEATAHVVEHARCRVAVVDSLANMEKLLQVKKKQQEARERRLQRAVDAAEGQAGQNGPAETTGKRETNGSSWPPLSPDPKKRRTEGGAGLGESSDGSHALSEAFGGAEETGACDVLQMIVVYRERVPEGYEDDGVISFEDFVQLGSAVNDVLLTARMETQKPGECCSLVYTSGTTGFPKGVMLSHDNFTWTAACSSHMMKIDHTHRLVSFLPLSHVAAQLVDLYMPVTMGCCVYFARPDALQGSLIETVKHVRPTWFLAVPRVWEKIEQKLKEVAAARGSGFKSRIAEWAKNVGFRGTEALLNGHTQDIPAAFTFVMRLILHQVRKALGMDLCLGLGSCAAPLDPETQKYFMSLGMPINSIYGLSESTGPQTFILPAPGWYKVGSIGHALPGTDMYVANENEEGHGEICFRGRNIFMGYYKDEKSTRGTVDENGFLHTGDLGYVDSDGFVYLTGRIKELIITAGGENVAPLLIESLLKQEMPQLLSNCMVVGDRRKFLGVLICLYTAKDKDDNPTNVLAPDLVRFLKKKGLNAATTQDAMDAPGVNHLIREAIERANIKTISRAQSVQGWRILPADFAISTGELTATMKLRRKFVETKFASFVEDMYLSPLPRCLASAKAEETPGALQAKL
ncbi:putative very long-chain acyl-CoA synthetase [Neospora caninum Liverpool]|uniref:Putative very long-chain acyl-CoA synthetase n=1 Tax=Neospora caninum (strain Liverpool) TaxID=572307 RepID=F0V8W4_NEOCL|nr:putative very long-chain acyl-CoA synthetase [Neospora caninum Liverpool]CBZ50155.1 putative very long-chain acyl-CoA synthetase [Neospora caninum Liverpool]CEL64750.1 TPA: very long-chain acyl-CoA synthetase, putative [Neospora caninum Liverpool]|eukprot:XP_003880190.1 putative very long-chain acyl-CoA synthetase [Neospora caninum Liverpool]